MKKKFSILLVKKNMQIFGVIAIIIGLILLAVSGYGYYEEMEHKPIPIGIEGMLYKYRMWLAIAGLVIVLMGGTIVWYEQ